MFKPYTQIIYTAMWPNKFSRFTIILPSNSSIFSATKHNIMGFKLKLFFSISNTTITHPQKKKKKPDPKNKKWENKSKLPDPNPTATKILAKAQI